MGLAFVLLFWLAIGLILALLVGLPLGIRVWKKDSFAKAKKWMLFPFLCLVLLGAIFFVQMLGNELLLGQDPGIGDSWSVRLPGGDQLLMIDVTAYGWLLDEEGRHRLEHDADIVTLQVAGGVYLGGTTRRAFDQLGRGPLRAESYFLANPRSRSYQRFQSEQQLQAEASNRGIQLQLKPIADVYSDYRNRTLDWIALAAYIYSPYWLYRRRRGY